MPSSHHAMGSPSGSATATATSTVTGGTAARSLWPTFVVDPNNSQFGGDVRDEGKRGGRKEPLSALPPAHHHKDPHPAHGAYGRRGREVGSPASALNARAL